MTIGKKFGGAAVRTSLVGSMTAVVPGTGQTFSIVDASGYPTTGPFVVTINEAENDEEKILCSSISGTVLTVDIRGYDGTVAISHDAGASVTHHLDALTVTSLVTHVDDTATDDHTQYLNVARHDLTTRHQVGTVVPAGVVPGTIAPDDTADEGVANAVARADHRHANFTDPAGASAVADTAAEGVAASFSRSDHRHSREAFAAPVSVGTANAAGAATTVPRSDHVHDIGNGAIDALALFAAGLKPVFRCTAATRPAHDEGLLIYETDTERIYASDGTAWLYIAGGASPMGPVWAGTVPTAERITSSTAFVDWPVSEPIVTASFTKMESASRLFVHFEGSGYVTGAAGSVIYAVRIDVTDYAMKKFFFNTFNQHDSYGTIQPIPGIPAGTYTATLRARVVNAATVLHADQEDENELYIEEVR